MATNDIKPSSSLPAVLEDITKRELDRPRTRRDIFDLAKKAIQIGGGSALDKSKIGDWIIGDEAISRDVTESMMDLIAASFMENVYGDRIWGTIIGSEMDEEGVRLLEGHRDVDMTAFMHNIEDDLLFFSKEEGETKKLESLQIYKKEVKDLLNRNLTYNDRAGLENLELILDGLGENISLKETAIKNLKKGLDKKYPKDLANHLYDKLRYRMEIVTPDEEGVFRKFGVPAEWSRHGQVEGATGSTDLKKKMDYDISKVIEEEIQAYKKEKQEEEEEKQREDKGRRLIDSAADLARRLSAPPTGTVPRDRQVKPPVQEPKPTQPKIPTPRATIEQPTEQGKGLSNLARMLPAVGRRLPFIAPAATLLRSKPAGVDADIVPPDPLGTGRVYRNYHDYNPRNI